MAGYWVVHATNAADQAVAEEYVKLWKPVAQKYQAKVLVAGGQFETVEGDEMPRHLIIEFPSYQMALDCYHDNDYQNAMEYVRKAFERNLVILEGVQD